MTQDVLLTISGLHDMAFADPEENEENEPIEVITPASYYWKNGKHYILYDEVMEGIPGVVKNKIKITGEDSMEIMKSGITNAPKLLGLADAAADLGMELFVLDDGGYGRLHTFRKQR